MTVIIRKTTPALVLGALFSITSPVAPAAELPGEAVRAAVETWVRYVTADARPDAVIAAMEPYVVDGHTAGYIAHLSEGGFCLCGADDLVLPVYLYSPEGSYDPTIPDYQCILQGIDTSLTLLRTALEGPDPALEPYQDVLADRAAIWADLIAGRIPVTTGDDRTEPVVMELDLTCRWSQGSPYNDQCPELIPGTDSHTVTGCVPTATAQTMYYWQWPPTGEGQIAPGAGPWYPRRYSDEWIEEPLPTNPNPFYFPGIWVSVLAVPGSGRLQWTEESGGLLRMDGYWDISLTDRAKDLSANADYRAAVDTLYQRLIDATEPLSADFGSTTYDWSILHDEHEDPPGLPEAEVARICFHVGVAINVRYGFLRTSGDTTRVGPRLAEYFRYDPDGVWHMWDGQNSVDGMTEEIQWLRPVVMSGCGHAWIAYGYNRSFDPHRQFLMNMGWGGSTAHVWYTCDGTPPSYCSGLDGHTAGTAPEHVVKFVGNTSPGDGSPDDPYENVLAAIEHAPDGATLIFKAGSLNTFSGGPLVIDRPLTLRGCNVIVARE